VDSTIYVSIFCFFFFPILRARSPACGVAAVNGWRYIP
jgi:hypothetical protein